MKVIFTFTQTQPYFWLHQHDGKVDVIEATYAETTGLTGKVTGPYLSDTEAEISIRDILGS